MRLIAISFLLYLTQGTAIITKNNGEEVWLLEVRFFQSEDDSVTNSLVVIYRGKEMVMELDNLKRINLKESLGRKRGVTTWKAILITTENEKYEVEMDFVQLKGVNSEGKVESYSSNIINKISL